MDRKRTTVGMLQDKGIGEQGVTFGQGVRERAPDIETLSFALASFERWMVTIHEPCLDL